MAKKRALGKGLGELIPELKNDSAEIKEVILDDITPNPFQPRTNFDDDSLQELATSIHSIGIVQPITVRITERGHYEIIAGERRYRAAKMAGLKTIPAYIRDANDENILELALIENIQREDLNAIEVAISYRRLIDECNLTQDALGERIGKSRTNVTNYLRLLKLPAEIQLSLRERKISMGHARALVGLEDEELQFMIFEQILKEGLSVRQVEEIVRRYVSPKENSLPEAVKMEIVHSKDYMELQNLLSERLDTKVELKRNTKGKGKIVISFMSDSDLERIMDLLDKLN